MTIADEARDNALHCEMVKYAYRQTKDGIVVSFVMHPNDIPAQLSTSHIGSRFMVALVQLGDDELPIKQKEVMPHSAELRAHNAPPRHDTPRSAGAKRGVEGYVNRKWDSLLPSTQAGIRSHDVVFEAFLRETRPDDWHEASSADECLKLICGITSKTELVENQKARALWHQLDLSYQAWEAKERVGA